MDQRKKRGFGRKASLAGVIGLAGAAMAACDIAPPENAVFDFLRMGWPQGITPEATAMGNFWVWVWVAAWIIGFIMWGIFLYAVFGKWNAKKAEKRGDGEFPKQLQYNVPLELVLTIVPIVIVMVIFFFTVQTQERVVALNKNPEVEVDVTAFQWNWKFGYANVSGSLTGDGQDYAGLDEDRQANAEASRVEEGGVNPIHGKSKSDISFLNFNEIETLGTSDEIPVLVLPSNTPVQFNLASGDVAHSFWVPEFLFKRDAFAHPEANQQQRSFQIEAIEEEGAFVGRCAEMCGTYHAMMNFELRVVSPEAFTEYLAFRQANPEAPNSQALQAIGEDPYAITTRPFSSDRNTADGNNSVDPAANL